MIEKLPLLVLNPHSRCNCRCLMCDIWKRDTVDEIGPERFRQQLESIDQLGVEWVVFSGGEALMHSDLFSLCRELRARNIRVTLLSSGLLLGRSAREIVTYADDVIVSLDGPPEIHNSIRRVARAFELLTQGVETVRAMRADFPITGRCTIQRLNCGYLTATAAAARRIGLNSISFLAADTHSEAFNHALPVLASRAGIQLTADDLPVLEGQLDTLIASGECGRFVLETPEKLRRITRHFRASLDFEQHVAPACNAPWHSAVIEADGAVRPCFFHPPIGYLNDSKNLRQILNSPEAIAFRQDLNVADHPLCRRCVCSLNWKGPPSQFNTLQSHAVPGERSASE